MKQNRITVIIISRVEQCWGQIMICICNQIMIRSEENIRYIWSPTRWYSQMITLILQFQNIQKEVKDSRLNIWIWSEDLRCVCPRRHTVIDFIFIGQEWWRVWNSYVWYVSEVQSPWAFSLPPPFWNEVLPKPVPLCYE